MKVLVLAAGYGLRLRPLTSWVPKPLVHIANVPLLELHLYRLHQYGIRSVYVNRHHLADFFPPAGTWKARTGVEVVYLDERELPYGTGGAVRNLVEKEGLDDILVINGDSFHLIDYGPFLQKPRDETLALLSVREDSKQQYSVLGWNSDTRSLDPTEVPDGWFPVMYGGVARLTQRLVRMLPSTYPSDWFADALVPSFRQQERVMACLSKELWWDFGHADDFFARCGDFIDSLGQGPRLWGDLWERMSQNGSWRAIGVWAHPTAEIADDTQFTGWAMIGERCRITGGSCIHQTILEPEVQVENAELRECYVIRGTQLKGFKLQQAIVRSQDKVIDYRSW